MSFNFKRLKIKRIIILFIVIIFVAVGLMLLINNIKYKKSYEYKLIKIGYNTNEISKIKSSLKDKEVDKILTMTYDKNIVKFIKEKYFIFSNLKGYLDYYKENESLKFTNIVAIINTNSEDEWYKNVRNTDVNKGNLMLVNKYYALSSEYVPEDLVLISTRYSYNGNYASESILDSLINMIDAAKEEGYTLIVSQGYRSYEDQKEAYETYEKYHTTEEADVYAARAGHSEYQTGLSVLIKPYNKVVENVTNSEEYNWIINNSYKFGFILRYPEGKEKITGFTFDPWRYRYVGIEVAQKIHEENITFDEYYAYYLEK